MNNIFIALLSTDSINKYQLCVITDTSMARTVCEHNIAFMHATNNANIGDSILMQFKQRFEQTDPTNHLSFVGDFIEMRMVIERTIDNNQCSQTINALRKEIARLSQPRSPPPPLPMLPPQSRPRMGPIAADDEAELKLNVFCVVCNRHLGTTMNPTHMQNDYHCDDCGAVLKTNQKNTNNY